MGSIRRILAMVLKEFTSFTRDPSMLLIGLFLPAVLIMIFGLGLSMDVRHVPVAVVSQSDTPLARRIITRLVASDYFRAATVKTRQEAEAQFHRHEVSAIVHIPPDFDEQSTAGEGKIAITVHAVDANQATMIRTYVNALIGTELTALNREGRTPYLFPDLALKRQAADTPTLMLRSRAWFNEANDSSWYLVPGLLVITMTLVGSFLTSLVVAREWERGTVESLFSTPLTPLELFLGQLIPNLIVALIGTILALIVAVLLFSLPLRGSIGWLALNITLFQTLACIFGLFLSAHFKRQFLAMQFAIIGSFLPSIMLSGFLFDLRSVPAWISVIGHLLPPTYAITSLKICFLSGGTEDILATNLAVIAGWTLFFSVIAVRSLKKTLDGGLHA